MSTPTHARRRWPLLVIGASAGTAVWAGWVGLGELVGFGVIHPLPGIWDAAQINTAITLPIGVEAYAMYALSVATTTAPITAVARRFAWISSAGALILGMAGQVAYHLMAADQMDTAPWPIVAAVSCLPVVVLGFASVLWHLAGHSPAAAADSTGIDLPIDSSEPDSIEPSPADRVSPGSSRSTAIESTSWVDRIEPDSRIGSTAIGSTGKPDSIAVDSIESGRGRSDRVASPDVDRVGESTGSDRRLRSVRDPDRVRAAAVTAQPADVDRVAELISAGSIADPPSAEAIRRALRCSPARARAARDVLRLRALTGTPDDGPAPQQNTTPHTGTPRRQHHAGPRSRNTENSNSVINSRSRSTLARIDSQESQ